MPPKIVAVPDLLHTLPIGDSLEWKSFEQFCTDLLALRTDIVNAREYLQQGNDQQGIDIYAKEDGSDKLIVAQCKLKEYVSPQEVEEIIELFLKGAYKDETKEFILCTNYDFTKHRDEKAIADARARLAESGIELTVWDWRGISGYLRQNPQPGIVARYFGPELSLLFYGSIYTEYLKQYLKIDKPIYKIKEDHIERRVLSYSGHLQRTENKPYYWIDKAQYLTIPQQFKIPGRTDGLKVILLSTAGFGKTWEMENLAGYFSRKEEPLFPVRNYLKDYEGQSIVEILDIFNKDWKHIPEESLILIFDGLDEIKGEYYQTFINHLNQFCEARQKINVIVSTRYNFYNVSAGELRDFEPFVLDSFDEDDIDYYIEDKLGSDQLVFREKVEQAGLAEYLGNPYYLARMVSLFAIGKEKFPRNKAGLFEEILFQRLEREKEKYQIKEKRELLLTLAQKVAFCMTMLGKSNLNEGEMAEILENQAQIDLFKRFFLMNKEGERSGKWSFEHKNLQEYLCASFFLENDFNSILPLVSFQHEKAKLQPRFLNTFSFLFTIADLKGQYFKELFGWLNSNEPELLVRFEKERLTKAVRSDIFKRIIDYYDERNIMLFASTNFRVDELADFVEMDEETIAYIDSLLLAAPRDWLARDLIELLSETKRAFRFEGLLKDILFRELNTRPANPQYAQGIIEAFGALKFFEPGDAAQIMHIVGDLDNFEIRRALVNYLSTSGQTDSYPDFILDSIAIYEKRHQSGKELFADEGLKVAVISLEKAGSIIKILNYGTKNGDFMGPDGSGEVKLEAGELSEILRKALIVLPDNQRLLGAVYKLFRSLQSVSFYQEWLTPFQDFFAQTCGFNCIFKKLYRYDKSDYNLIAFTEEESYEFLIQEHKAGNISIDQMRAYRNDSRTNTGLYEKFTERLAEEFGDKFLVATTTFDHQANNLEYATKNQQFLLDKNLFIAELEAIFKHIGKDAIAAGDLYSKAGHYHNPFTPSIAFSEIRRKAGNIPKTLPEIVSFYKTDNQWESFKITQIMRMLENRKKKELTIDQQLIDFASDWTKMNIEKQDYVNSVRDNGTGGVILDIHIESINKLFVFLELDLPDNLLLKLLLSDHRGGSRGELSLTKIVLERIKDKDLLKKTVLENIKKGQATWVLLNHFSICEELHYTECQANLFRAISSNMGFSENDKTRLAEIYLSLGGEIEDFTSMVSLPDPSEDKHAILWKWYLIKNLLHKKTDLILPIVEQVIAGPDFSDHQKLIACELLLSIKNLDGLRYWLNYIKKNRKRVFNHRQEPIMTNCPYMPIEQTVPIFIEALAFAYANGLDKTLKFPDSIVDAAFNALAAISKTGLVAFNAIMGELDLFMEKHKAEDFAKDISSYREQIINGYYQSDQHYLSLQEVLINYKQMVQSKNN